MSAVVILTLALSVLSPFVGTVVSQHMDPGLADRLDTAMGIGRADAFGGAAEGGETFSRGNDMAAFALPTGVVTTGGVGLRMRSQAKTSSTSVKLVPDKTRLTLTCWVKGETITSLVFPGYVTDLWHKVSYGGKTGYVTDAYMNTGVDGVPSGEPKCGSTTPAPAPSTSKATKAADWAKGQVGSLNYSWLCELFVENSYGTSGQFASAVAHYNWQRDRKRIQTGTPPRGAMVFYATDASNGYYGHVAISDGSGYAFSNVGTNGAIIRHKVVGYLNIAYLGWAWPPDSWPGR